MQAGFYTTRLETEVLRLRIHFIVNTARIIDGT